MRQESPPKRFGEKARPDANHFTQGQPSARAHLPQLLRFNKQVVHVQILGRVPAHDTNGFDSNQIGKQGSVKRMKKKYPLWPEHPTGLEDGGLLIFEVLE